MSEPSELEIEVFNAALELPSNERDAYLDQACGRDAAMRQRLETLLKFDGKAGDFLEKPACVSAVTQGKLEFPEIADEAKPGGRIGRYLLLQQIGEGGCGVVYVAEQEKPVRRQVALKIIKLGMDTKNVIARFEVERQALAIMDHPNIAKVLDAGATESGRPYFVMELVPGRKITDYCDENHLSTRERLDLFMQVCRAVQHAHQKGIIHRDLKPSNILVTTSDGVAVPKVIDFGIAKATHGKLTDQTIFTAFEQFIGTPAYMSPEQAEISAQDIDTRSDIYSLGVLLYELLTGRTPFDSRKLLQAGLDEIRRTIREEEPTRPSTRLSTMLGADLTQVGKHRNAEPPKLIQLVRGDLDWIVMKALEKDRTRRYETANGLAMDLQRHLNNEPVVACPPSNLYKFQKLVRRNKLIFTAAGCVATALLLALGVAMVAVVRIKSENRQIRQAKNDATEKLRATYLAEARATRLSGQTGHRFASLAAVQQAAAIRPDLAARTEAIACLAVSDLQVEKQRLMTEYPRNENFKFDLNAEHYAYEDGNGITIRATSNKAFEAVLRAPGFTLQGVDSFSPDGRYLSARYRQASEGISEWVWDIVNRRVLVHTIQRPNETQTSNPDLAGNFSPDSRFFFSSLQNNSISVYELPSGREVKQFPGQRRYNLLAADPANTRLACCSLLNSRVDIRELDSGQILRTVTGPAAVSACAWSSDGQRLATAGLEFKIHIWEAATGHQLIVLAGNSTAITSLAFDQAGDLLANTGFDNVVRLWDAHSGRQLASHPGSVGQIQFSPDSHCLLGWHDGANYGSLAVAYSRECRLLYLPPDRDSLSLPVFSPDGRLLAAATNRKAHFWEVASGREIGSLPTKDCNALFFRPDGRHLITVDQKEGIRKRSLEHVGGPASNVWRLGLPRHLFDTPMLKGATLSQDGRYLVAAQPASAQSFVFDLQNPAAKLALAGHLMVDDLAVSPDGRWVATSSKDDPLIKLWDARSGVCQHTLSAPSGTGVAFSPDGRWLATSASEYQLWATGSWEPKGSSQPGCDAPAASYTAFSPDGQMMARTEFNRIQLIETGTGQPLAHLETPGSSALTKCQFSPDGTQLAAVQLDQQIQLWDLRLIRQELVQMHLDWDLPPYPPVAAMPAGPVALEIESETNSESQSVESPSSD